MLSDLSPGIIALLLHQLEFSYKMSLETDTSNPDYYHRIVDCQWACPAHTPVPEYIRLIGEGRYNEAYLLNRSSNVFPGILGRVCDRPCEPACRRTRIDQEPVAICRLKRAASDFKDVELYKHIVQQAKDQRELNSSNSQKKIALIGAGPACLTVANDLLLLGYHCEIFDRADKPGGAVRTQVPAFRLPEDVLNEEIAMITEVGLEHKWSTEVKSLKSLIAKDYFAIVVGTGAPRAKDLNLPGRQTAGGWVHLAYNWLEGVAFGHIDKIAEKVVIIGGGNTAMDCARTARRLGAKTVTVIAPETYEQMLASPWEKSDALHEEIEFKNLLLPEAFNSSTSGNSISFSKLSSCYDEKDGKKIWNPIKESAQDLISMPCDEVILAIGQTPAFPFVESDSGVLLKSNGLPQLDEKSFQSTHEKVFFVGDAAFGPKNIITAVAQGHEVAISIDMLSKGLSLTDRPATKVEFVGQKLGYQQWAYRTSYSDDDRQAVPEVGNEARFKSLAIEVEKGFTQELAKKETQRCLNCDVQTIFYESKCIECDACVDVCPLACLTIVPKKHEQSLEEHLTAQRQSTNLPLYAQTIHSTGTIMVKDEDLCVHCGLCAERCPTAAWDMQLSTFAIPKAGSL